MLDWHSCQIYYHLEIKLITIIVIIIIIKRANLEIYKGYRPSSRLTPLLYIDDLTFNNVLQNFK